MSTLYSSGLYGSSLGKSTPAKNAEHYGKAGLVTTTKKELVPVETTQTHLVEHTEHKVTPVKKYHYVEGHGLIDYTTHEISQQKSHVPVVQKKTEYYEIESDHMKCPITEIESPSHNRRVKKVGEHATPAAPTSSYVSPPPVQSSYVQPPPPQQSHVEVPGSKTIKQTIDNNDATHHIVQSKKVVPVQKSHYVPGHGIVSYTAHEVQDHEEVITIPKEKVAPIVAQSIIQTLRAWIKARNLDVDQLYKQYDINHDGKLQYHEIEKLFKACNPAISSDECNKAFRFFDSNNDKVVDSQEFKTLLKYD